MASGQFPSAQFGGGGLSVPFIQSSPMILNGPAGLGLEGVGFSGGAMEMALLGVGGTRAIGASQQQQQQQQQVGKSGKVGEGGREGGMVLCLCLSKTTLIGLNHAKAH